MRRKLLISFMAGVFLLCCVAPLQAYNFGTGPGDIGHTEHFELMAQASYDYAYYLGTNQDGNQVYVIQINSASTVYTPLSTSTRQRGTDLSVISDYGVDLDPQTTNVDMNIQFWAIQTFSIVHQGDYPNQDPDWIPPGLESTVELEVDPLGTFNLDEYYTTHSDSVEWHVGEIFGQELDYARHVLTEVDDWEGERFPTWLDMQDHFMPESGQFILNYQLSIDITYAIIDIETDPTAGGQPVPEPATMLLLGSGLIGIAGFRRKKR